MRIRQSVQEQAEALCALRRDLHRIPETAFEEFKTSRYIYQHLEQMHPDVLDTFLGTGVKAVFLAPRAARTVAIRADMDALPVSEETGLAFASCHSGRMHACGHDGHMAIALTTAQIVSSARRYLDTNYVFLFQPAEETTGGAEPLIAAGVLDDPRPEAMYGLHMWPFIQESLLGLRSGPLMAGVREVDITVHGRSCHGARPQDGSDAVVAGAQFISALQTIVSRNIDPEQAALFTVGRVAGGTARNIICGELRLEGTVRAYTPEVQAQIAARTSEILSGLEKMFGVHCTVRELASYPPVINPAELFEHVVACFAPDEWVIPERVMISEDFSFYQEVVPAFFAFLGTGSGEHQEPLHSSRFSFSDRVLAAGVEYYLRVTGFPQGIPQ